MLEKILETCKYVSDNSKYVKINYDVVDIFVKNFKEPKFWLSSNPFNILDLNIQDITNFLLIYHTIGDYSFWGEPKWKIKTTTSELDGSYAIMYLIINRYKSNKNFNMSFNEFSKLLEKDERIPLLKERYDELVIMNNFLKNNSFYDLIKDITDDETLFNYVISNLTYFIDTRTYNGQTIYFYKRAQLLTSDILHVRELLENIKVDYSHLVGCADYKIPQVMNSLGMLEYNEELNQKIKAMSEIKVNSEMEVEIRANTLVIIDYIARKLDNKISRIDINDYIWLLGQDKSKINKPYHRTRTINY